MQRKLAREKLGFAARGRNQPGVSSTPAFGLFGAAGIHADFRDRVPKEEILAAVNE